MMPKFAVFALRRMSAVTSFISILYILAAVAAWMSCPLRKASIIVLIFAEVCHDAQLYLRVVGREELAAGVGDERLADFLSVFVADGDVLQVGIAGAEASGSGYRLVEGGVYAVRTWLMSWGRASI